MLEKQGGRPTLRMTAGQNVIYRRLYDAIVQQHIVPGTKLNEKTLAETFAVSRASIRPILARLAHEGVVEIRPYRGAFVAKPSPKTTRDLYEIRRFLECSLVAKMASELDRDSIQELRKIVDAEREAQARDDMEERLRLSGEFHYLLARFSGNEIYQEILGELVSRTSLAIALYRTPRRSGCRCEDHHEIVKCIEARNGKQAAQVMEDHLNKLQDELHLETPDASYPDLKAILMGTGSLSKRTN